MGVKCAIYASQIDRPTDGQTHSKQRYAGPRGQNTLIRDGQTESRQVYSDIVLNKWARLINVSVYWSIDGQTDGQTDGQGTVSWCLLHILCGQCQQRASSPGGMQY